MLRWAAMGLSNKLNVPAAPKTPFDHRNSFRHGTLGMSAVIPAIAACMAPVDIVGMAFGHINAGLRAALSRSQIIFVDRVGRGQAACRRDRPATP